MHKRILLITNTVNPKPNNGGGSVVLFRHLKRLEDNGFEVIFIHGYLKDTTNNVFKELSIKRKFWHPPLRQQGGFFTYLKCHLEVIFIKNSIEIRKSDVLLAILGDYMNLTAYLLSRKFQIPLHLIFHDDNVFSKYSVENILTRKQVLKIINQASTIFPVSEPMLALVNKFTNTKSKLLYPIPEGINNEKLITISNDILAKPFKGVYSGMLLWNIHEVVIRKISAHFNKAGATLELISGLEKSVVKSIQETTNIEYRKQFETVAELIDHIVDNCSFIFVFYSFDIHNEPRLTTSFPSKFVEFCHLGLPIIIISPSVSAISSWAKQNDWLTSIDNLEDDSLLNLILKLRNPEFYDSCVKQVNYFALNDFNPDKIHEIFENELLETI